MLTKHFKLDPTSAIGSVSLEIPGEYLDEDQGEKPETKSEPIDRVDVEHYAPFINEEGEWILSELDLGTNFDLLDRFYNTSINPPIRVDFRRLWHPRDRWRR